MLPWSCLAVNTTHPVRATSRPELANVCVAPPGPGGAVSHEQAPLVAADHVRVVVLVQQVPTPVATHLHSARLEGETLLGVFLRLPRLTLFSVKTYIVFCHAELCITPFTGLSLFGQVEAAAGRYQAKHQKRSQSRKKLHCFRYLVTDYSEPGDEVDKGDCQVWMTSRADVCEGTAAAFPPRR